MTDDIHSGSCACGGVAFEMTGPLRPVVACHCTQCRKTSGHYWAATSVPKDRFRLIRDDTLRWFRSSDTAERGFCATCGASLFWHPSGKDTTHAAPGSFDAPTGLAIAEHWFTEDAGDYYSPEGPPPPPRSVAPRAARMLLPLRERALRPARPGRSGHRLPLHTVPQDLGPLFSLVRCRRIRHHWHDRRGLATFTTAGGATRGHCARCGSSLWFRAADGTFSVEAGCVTGPTGGRLASHIFTGEKGDYHSLKDGLPQKERLR